MSGQLHGIRLISKLFVSALFNWLSIWGQTLSGVDSIATLMYTTLMKLCICLYSCFKWGGNLDCVWKGVIRYPPFSCLINPLNKYIRLKSRLLICSMANALRRVFIAEVPTIGELCLLAASSAVYRNMLVKLHLYQSHS